ncbi:DUF485 domain-containing protein [Lichenicola sp.]|uniref:DUF485 domain-containing protein n=1 Tax=Lichenicola sp. TaxID=2804529 RepID=UPI003AFFD865
MLDTIAVAQLRQDPRLIALTRARARVGWTLAALMVAIYFGFVFLVAFAPHVLATPVWGVITLGFPLGLLVILSAIVLTAIYVSIANRRFDPLQRAIVADVR